MEIYYSVFIIAFLLCFFDFIGYKAIKIIPYILFCLFVILVAGFRQVGTDNDSYNYSSMYQFYSISSLPEIIKGGYGYVERGYVLLNKLVSVLGFDVHILFILMAFLTGIATYSFLYKRSKFVFLSLLFYLSFNFLYRDFTQIRYAFSAALCFWVVAFYVDKKYKKSILFFVLAVFFHSSVFILIPVFLVERFVKRNIWYFLPIVPAFIIGKMLNLFPILLLLGAADGHMATYLNEESGGGLMISAIGLVIMLLYYLITFKKKERNREMDIYFRILSICVSLNFLFIQSGIFQRFTFILFQFAILLFPYILKELYSRVRIKGVFVLIYFVSACFFLYYGVKMIDINLVRPYKTFFE